MKKSLLFGLVLLVALGILVPRASADATVYVGYADDLRPSPFFPIPWSGGANVTFVGNASNVDAGAIRIDNTGASSFIITDISVNINGTGMGDIWLSSMPITVAPGHILIVTQTTPYNFDTSDVHPITSSGAPCLGLGTDPPQCSVHPTFTVTFMGGGTATFDDTGHVLDTGGFDLATANPCPNPADPGGNCNESLNWRLVGTTGIGNPGGVTPEPGSLVLLGTGIASLVMRRRKQA
jgi:hypothetical protein